MRAIGIVAAVTIVSIAIGVAAIGAVGRSTNEAAFPTAATNLKEAQGLVSSLLAGVRLPPDSHELYLPIGGTGTQGPVAPQVWQIVQQWAVPSHLELRTLVPKPTQFNWMNCFAGDDQSATGTSAQMYFCETWSPDQSIDKVQLQLTLQDVRSGRAELVIGATAWWASDRPAPERADVNSGAVEVRTVDVAGNVVDRLLRSTDAATIDEVASAINGLPASGTVDCGPGVVPLSSTRYVDIVLFAPSGAATFIAGIGPCGLVGVTEDGTRSQPLEEDGQLVGVLRQLVGARPGIDTIGVDF